MKQVFAKKGKIELEEVTTPNCGDEEIKVRVHYSVISVGTELNTVRKLKQPLYKTALEKKDLTKKILKKAQKEGYIKTYKYAKSMINNWWPLGYSCSGEVIEVGNNVDNFSVGDYVACGGQDYASHAEIVCVPQNLVVKISKDSEIDLREAAHTTIGAIAIQGVRRLKVTFGEKIVVYGLGLIGQIVSQVLEAAGCEVIGIDIDEKRASRAKVSTYFTNNVTNSVLDYTNNIGADGVIITAASSSEEIINNAMNMCRKKGRVVLLGNVPMNINREAMYKKELDFFISTSYGPGRYDQNYEEKSNDYPIAYVRWTENRNMQEFIRLLKEKKVVINPIIDQEYSINEAEMVYNKLFEREISPLSVIFNYPASTKSENENNCTELKKIIIKENEVSRIPGKINVALIGVGNFAKGTHLPNVKKIKEFNLKAIVTKNPGSAKNIAINAGAEYFTNDYQQVLNDPSIDLVIVSTRHKTHAQITGDALSKGKHVLVEKPMGLNLRECQEIITKINENPSLVYSVGFNRNYAPLTQKIVSFLQNRKYPLMINFRVNTKPTTMEDWVNDPEEGGGRIIGEMCHMFSFFNYIINSKVKDVKAFRIDSSGKVLDNNNITVIIKYEDGSIANLVYTDYANDSLSKERVEIFGGGNALVLNDFDQLQINGNKTKQKQDKGHFQELVELSKKLKGEKSVLTNGKHAYEAMQICFKVISCLKSELKLPLTE
jgi:predicted dehydrogenase/threonine dehydrogenase-like Zn-dependent dehydrogenase